MPIGQADVPWDKSLSLFSNYYLGLGVYQFWIPSRARLLGLQRLNGGPHASSGPPRPLERIMLFGSEPHGVFSTCLGQLIWHGHPSLMPSCHQYTFNWSGTDLERFIHSLHKYLLSTYCVPSPVSGPRDTASQRNRPQQPCPCRFLILWKVFLREDALRNLSHF